MDVQYIENKFFHVFTVDFIVDESLNPWIFNINSDPSFTKKSSYDNPKKGILEDIVKNWCLQVVKNMKSKEFKKIRLKENNKQFVRVIADTVLWNSFCEKTKDLKYILIIRKHNIKLLRNLLWILYFVVI